MFFKEYRNNKVQKDKYANGLRREDIPNVEEPPITLEENNNKIKDTLENIDKIKTEIKKNIMDEKVKGDPFFDEEIFKHLDILNEFIKNYIKDYPKYYDSDGNINPKAFLDSRDFIKNEIPITAEEIINTPTSINGVTNDTKMNFENGYQVDYVGNVYNPNKEMVFIHNEPAQKIKYIDILNKKIITENGIRIDLPDSFIREQIMENELVSEKTKNEIKDFQNKIENIKEFIKVDNIYAIVNNVPITEENKKYIELPVDDLFLGDIFGEDMDINLSEQMRRYQVTDESMGICNFKDIPYSKLNSLLFWGGGEKGVKPLSSTAISDKDISFAANGTVYYSGVNSTVSTRRPGCKGKTFKTGHVCMYSESNKLGLKTSIIQYLHKFGSMCGIFNANIPMLVGYKKFQVFPGLCIGGLLEQLLMGWQERISKQINEMFQCMPAKYPYDASESGFENETYLYGSSVSSLADLDKIKSCKVGDKYVVEVVPKEITGLKENACGVFIFDPNDKYSSLFKWKYKNFRGKPFSYKDSSPSTKIQGFENMYNNPIIQDTLMNTNALGEDSITRRLMSLQYAYQMKQALLSIQDVKNSTDSIIENAIYDVLDKLTDKLANYIIMLDSAGTEKLNQTNSFIPSRKFCTSMSYANKFLSHFSFLTSSGALKEVPLSKCKVTKQMSMSGEGTGTSSVTVEYYDFSLYDSSEYLLPSYDTDHIKEMDAMEFAYKYVPSSELNELFENNKKYMNVIGGNANLNSVKTIRDYINISESKLEYERDIEDNLKYIRHELNYSDFDDRGIDQVNKRCFYVIDKVKMF